MGFDRLHSALQHHIVNSLGWRDLRSVQELSIGPVLDGENLVILAPTAGGKTEAAFFPLISRLLESPSSVLSILYVSPIRALLNNQEVRLQRYFDLVGRRVGLWHGDVGTSAKQRLVNDPPNCLLTTPESLEVMLISSTVPHQRFFDHLSAIVVDEVHAFASDDRGWHLLSLLSRLSRLSRRDIQRIGLSATVGNPERLVEWLSSGSTRPRRVVRPPESSTMTAKVDLDFVGTYSNAAKVIHALHRGEKRLVFLDSRAGVEELAAKLRGLGTNTFVSHSSLGLEERRAAEQAFAQGENCVIVATSALELGIDVGDLDRVIQIDAPATVSSFLQRMGRTGRRPGTERNCLFLATDEESLLCAAAITQLWRQGFVEEVRPPPEPLHILAQQLLALSLQEKGIGRSEWPEWLAGVPAFSTLPPETIAAVVDGMVAKGLLYDDHGVLSIGLEGEKSYGRRNYLDLFAVFSAPPLFSVLHGRDELGSVHETTFLTRSDGPIVLLLGGRSWRVTHIDWERRLAHVERIETDGKSHWRGEGPMLSYELCQMVRTILTKSDIQDAWSQRASERIKAAREDHAWLRTPGASFDTAQKDKLRWWTFAGGRANACLAGYLSSRLGGRCRSDNFRIELIGAGEAKKLQSALTELTRIPPEGITPEVQPAALEGLKFSDCLPENLALSVVRRRLSDPAGVSGIIREVDGTQASSQLL